MAVRGVSAGERDERFVSELDPCPAPAVAVVVAAGHVDPRGGDTKEAARETKVSSCASLPDGEETSGEYPLPSWDLGRIGGLQSCCQGSYLMLELGEAAGGQHLVLQLGPWVTGLGRPP